MAELFRADGLCVGYGSGDVVRDISFTLCPGELCALLGANGSGKTTLLKGICRLLPSGGRLALNGSDMGRMSRRELARHIGYLSQRSGAPLSLNALDVVLMGFNPVLGVFQQPGAQHRERARRVLEQAGASELSEKNFLTLSEGQKQLILLARAMVRSPELVVLDEPDSALDFVTRRRILGLLREYAQAAPRAVLLCSHDVNVALAFASRLLLLKDGTLAYDIQTGTVPQDGLRDALRDVYGPVELLRHGGRYLMVEEGN